jgi:hypothetical protein
MRWPIDCDEMQRAASIDVATAVVGSICRAVRVAAHTQKKKMIFFLRFFFPL